MGTRGLVALATFLALTALGSLVPASGDSPPVYQVIVHPSNRNQSIDRHFLDDAFLKKVTVWPTGELVYPVDLVAGSSVRRGFTEDVLHRSVQAVKSYWQQRIFSGRDIPPPELASEDEVIAYVLKHEGAAGYVSPTADLRGTKALSVR
jgi:hypothetical protein